MKIPLEHALAYLEVILTFRGRSLSIRDTILDTGSAIEVGAMDYGVPAPHRTAPAGRTARFAPRIASWLHGLSQATGTTCFAHR